jgi:hypothetical protein
MTPVSRRIALTALLVASLTATAAAQSRRAVPRTAAPRSQPPAAAPAPQRAAEPRSRGTDNQGRARAPRDNDSGGGERVTSRSEPRERSRERTEERAAPPPTATNAAPSNGSTASTSSSSEEEQRRAVPRGSRPRGDNPAVGRAEPRDGRVYGGYPSDGRRSSRVYTSRGRVYNNYYYYYPRRWYPYGYGAFGGLGYFYYDPYTWYSYDPYWSRPHYYGSYGYQSHYGRDDYYYDTGELRLQVRPRHAEVYVDGYFAGNVDDFDGTFQALRLEEGPHKIEIVAPGHETLEFDVRIELGRKITYRGELRPRP